MKIAIAIASTLLCNYAAAQTIYRCGNSYSETPCANAQAVDIVPTDGAHSLSGKRRTSAEATHREINRNFDAAFEPAVGLKPGAMAAERERIKREQRARKYAVPTDSKIQWEKK